LSRKPPIVLYLVHTCRLSLKAGTGAAGIALWLAGS
jgi:hypothetical protein